MQTTISTLQKEPSTAAQVQENTTNIDDLTDYVKDLETKVSSVDSFSNRLTNPEDTLFTL